MEMNNENLNNMKEMESTKNCLLDRIKGSLIGGAIGDALGYPVEFESRNWILKKYREKGITRFETNARWRNGEKHGNKAIVSDDVACSRHDILGIDRIGNDRAFAIHVVAVAVVGQHIDYRSALSDTNTHLTGSHLHAVVRLEAFHLLNEVVRSQRILNLASVNVAHQLAFWIDIGIFQHLFHLLCIDEVSMWIFLHHE